MPKRLSRDVVVMFNGGGRPENGYEVRAVAGTALEEVHGGQGPSFAIPFKDCHVAPGVAALFKHDGYHHYVWAPEDAIEDAA
jgi:hypothetical protein